MTTAPLSLTSKMAFGIQSAQGTPVTTGLYCGRFVQSSLASVYEYIEAQGEHYCGVNVRPTMRKSFSRVGGYVVPFGAQGFLYPDVIGPIMAGLGFGLTSDYVATNETQTVTIGGSPSGGTFTLTYATQTTVAIAWNATAAVVEAALKGLNNLRNFDVVVTGAAGGPYTVAFQGLMAGTNVASMTGTATGLTPSGTVTIAPGTEGATEATDAYEHIGVIGNRSDAEWLTVLHGYGDGADAFTLRGTDARIEQLVIEATTRGVMMTVAGMAITEDAAAGTEVYTNETDAMLLPSKGSCTIHIENQIFTSPLRGLRFLISNPVARNEQNLFQLTRSDLPSTGMECGFSASGLDLSYDIYKKLKWGGSSGTGPVQGAVRGDIIFAFQSTEIVGTGVGAVPYSFGVTIPNCEFRMGNFQARGRDLIRFDLAGIMIDNESVAPITANLINGVASY